MIFRRTWKTKVKEISATPYAKEDRVVTIITHWFLFIPVYTKEL